MPNRFTCLATFVMFVMLLLASGGRSVASPISQTETPPDGDRKPLEALEQTAVLDDLTAAAAWSSHEIRISQVTTPDCDRYSPALAYNHVHHEYLVVWHNNWNASRDIYAQRISETGELLSWFTVTTGPNDRLQPSLAFNATNEEYLVVWMYDANGDGSTYEIRGRTVAWNGASMGPEFQVAAVGNKGLWTPRAAWNSYRNTYLVAWTALDSASGAPSEISHALLSDTGSLLAVTTVTSDRQPHQMDVVYNVASNEYLMVWRRMWAPADGDIMGALIDGDTGALLDPPGVFTVSGLTVDQLLPSVTTNGQHRYVVVWQEAYPGPCCDWDVRGHELDVSGNLATMLVIATSSEDELSPAVAAQQGGDRDYLAVWQEQTPSGQAIRATQWGDVTRGYFDVADYAFWNNETPKIAAGGSGYLIVYEGDSTGDPNEHRHIYGRIWARENVLLPIVRSPAP